MSDILITGGQGQVGIELAALAWPDGVTLQVPTRAELDLTSPDSVRAYFAGKSFAAIVNPAAYTAVDKAESEIGAAFAVNALGPALLAEAVRAADTPIVHISTDYVFDGDAAAPYDEAARPAPLSIYGISKYAGELALGTRIRRAFLFRTSGLYGLRGSSTKGHTFVERIREQALAGKPLRIVDDVTTAPSSTRDVAHAIRAIAEVGVFGTYHVTNSGSCTWYEFATEILATLAIEADIARTTSAAFPSYARRPAYSVLANNALERIGLAPLQRWQDALRDYLRARG